jgi:ApbE superfamily uncharacterized protein (UPF0280 family)
MVSSVSVTAADLVELDEDGVADAARDAVGEALGVGHEEVVADELDALAEALGEELPGVPVVLRGAVLDGEQGVLRAERLPGRDELRRP